MSYRKHHVKSKIKKLKPKRLILKNKWFWLLVLIIVFLGAVTWLFFFASFFKIDNISISGNKEIKTEDIKNIVERNANRNIFLVNVNNIQKEILNTFPEIKLAKAQKNYFKTLDVKVEERIPVAIFCSIENSVICYFVDESVIIFKEVKDPQNNFVIIKKELKENQIVLGEQIIKKDIISVVLKTQKMLKDDFGVDVEDAIIQNQSRLDIKTSENWQVYFAYDLDLDMQLTKLNLLLKGEISEIARKNLQYIDLRFKDRAYYK